MVYVASPSSVCTEQLVLCCLLTLGKTLPLVLLCSALAVLSRVSSALGVWGQSLRRS